MPDGRSWVRKAQYMWQIHRRCRPLALGEVQRWETYAATIPDPELQRQALRSLRDKQFHCEGGAAYAAGTSHRLPTLVQAICALQTLVDYLDNLSDRAGAQDAATLARLHRAVTDALTPGGPVPGRYYHPDEPNGDGGYLAALVSTCREGLAQLPGYEGELQRRVLRLGGLYSALQVLKHLDPREREGRLVRWLTPMTRRYPHLDWWELAAACGSTLGIFALLREAALGPVAAGHLERLYAAYFPWVGGLHILLDYYVDQEEDRRGGDLNFTTYYGDRQQALARLDWMAGETHRRLKGLDTDGFHRLILAGLPSLYLSDPKVAAMRRAPETRRLILHGGLPGLLAYLYCQVQPPGRSEQAPT